MSCYRSFDSGSQKDELTNYTDAASAIKLDLDIDADSFAVCLCYFGVCFRGFAFAKFGYQPLDYSSYDCSSNESVGHAAAFIMAIGGLDFDAPECCSEVGCLPGFSPKVNYQCLEINPFSVIAATSPIEKANFARFASKGLEQGSY